MCVCVWYFGKSGFVGRPFLITDQVFSGGGGGGEKRRKKHVQLWVSVKPPLEMVNSKRIANRVKFSMSTGNVMINRHDQKTIHSQTSGDPTRLNSIIGIGRVSVLH